MIAPNKGHQERIRVYTSAMTGGPSKQKRLRMSFVNLEKSKIFFSGKKAAEKRIEESHFFMSL